jgi:hypothetical protein
VDLAFYLLVIHHSPPSNLFDSGLMGCLLNTQRHCGFV